MAGQGPGRPGEQAGKGTDFRTGLGGHSARMRDSRQALRARVLARLCAVARAHPPESIRTPPPHLRSPSGHSGPPCEVRTSTPGSKPQSSRTNRLCSVARCLLMLPRQTRRTAVPALSLLPCAHGGSWLRVLGEPPKTLQSGRKVAGNLTQQKAAWDTQEPHFVHRHPLLGSLQLPDLLKGQ